MLALLRPRRVRSFDGALRVFTLSTDPMTFTGRVGIIQRNALHGWARCLAKFHLPSRPAAYVLYGFWRRRILGLGPWPG
jgi:hypothetical protein